MNNLFQYFTFVFVFANCAMALPTINSTSGAIIDNQTITITGSDFGTKSSPAPLAFKDFENSTVGSSISSEDTFWQCPLATKMTVSNSNQRHPRSSQNAEAFMDSYRATALCSADKIGLANTQKAYVNLWLRYMPVKDCACCWEKNLDSGSHTGSVSQTVLSDSTAHWLPDTFKNKYIYVKNTTNGMRSMIVSNTYDTITTQGAMSWETGHTYNIEASQDPQFKLWRITAGTDGNAPVWPYMALVHWNYGEYTSAYFAYLPGSRYFPRSAIKEEGWYNIAIQINQGTKGGNNFQFISWLSRHNSSDAYFIQDVCWKETCNGIGVDENWLDSFSFHNYIDMNCFTHTVKGTDGVSYSPKIKHNSGDGVVTKPITGSDWESYWVKARYSSNDAWVANVDYYPINTDAWAKHYYDDVYIDNTWARIEIGDSANYNSCSIREIQVPVAWNSDSITFKIKQGAFLNGSTAYLFVVDENGIVSTGYPVSFTENTIPDSPQTLRVAPRLK